MKLNKIKYITSPDSPNQVIQFDDKNFDFFEDLDIYKHNTSKEEHDKALKRIIIGINSNKEGIATKIDHILFAKAYPESMNYVNAYINEFYKNLAEMNDELREDVSFASEVTAADPKKFWTERKNNERKELAMLFYDYLVDKDNDVVMDTVKTLGLSKKGYISLIYDMNRYLGINDDLYVNQYKDIRDKYNKAAFDYHVNNNDDASYESVMEAMEIHGRFNKSYRDEILSNIDRLEQAEEMKIDEKDELLKLAELISNYAISGFDINGEHIPFTLLDFRSMINMDFDHFCYTVRVYLTENKKYNIDLANLMELLKAGNGGITLKTPQDFFKKKFAIINGDNRYEVDEELSNELFELFNQYSIPTKVPFLETAARRRFKGQPILPAIEMNRGLKSDEPAGELKRR